MMRSVSKNVTESEQIFRKNAVFYKMSAGWQLKGFLEHTYNILAWLNLQLGFWFKIKLGSMCRYHWSWLRWKWNIFCLNRTCWYSPPRSQPLHGHPQFVWSSSYLTLCFLTVPWPSVIYLSIGPGRGRPRPWPWPGPAARPSLLGPSDLLTCDQAR